MHMDALKSDPGYCKIKGIEKVADESTFHQFLTKFEQENISQLQQINQSLLVLRVILWVTVVTDIIRLAPNAWLEKR